MPCHCGSAVEPARRLWSPPNELGASSGYCRWHRPLLVKEAVEKLQVAGAADSGAAPASPLISSTKTLKRDLVGS
jgi:hypothetical protein